MFQTADATSFSLINYSVNTSMKLHANGSMDEETFHMQYVLSILVAGPSHVDTAQRDTTKRSETGHSVPRHDTSFQSGY